MEIKNIKITKSPVKSMSELYFGYSKYKKLVCETNLLELTTKETLFEQGFYDLASAVTNRNKILVFRGSENQIIIEDLARFAETNKDFFLKGVMVETLSQENEEFDKETFSILIKNQKVDVVIL